jgi:hypothetical protein
MSWTVICFCGTVFGSPAVRCPTCNARVPDEVTHAADSTERLRIPGGVPEVRPNVEQTAARK